MSTSPELFRELGFLDEERLKACIEMHQSFQKQGLQLDFSDVVLQMGAATTEQVARARAHRGTANLRCPKCRRRFTVPEYQAKRRYKCQECMEYLEIVIEEGSGYTSLVPPAPTAPGTVPLRPAAAAPLPPPRAVKPAAQTIMRPPAKDRFEGTTFAGYRVVRRVAKGGMGAVYLGEHPETGRRVAIKILTEEFSRMPGIQGRFKREGVAGARLEHPHIVETIESGQEGNYVYIISEYLAGGSLIDLVLREKKLDPKRAVQIISDVLSGLHHAHENGVIHRDIKPGNVLLDSDGRAKVIDFGLAKDAEANTILTLTGNVVGTPAYMSPEQARGDTAGPAADQYSCGILLWLMLTGRKPFEGKNLIETLKRQIEEPLPSARERNPQVPDALEKVLKKMCAKQANQRYASPAEAAVALQKAVGLDVDAALQKAALGKRSAVLPAAPSSAPGGLSRDWFWVLALIIAGLFAGILAAKLFLR